MTITATPNPSATPPSVTVDVDITPTYVMSAVAVYRNDHNGRTLLRSQPSAGFDSRTVTDYECPYEENVTYDWTANYIDPTAGATLFDELWASTAAWSVVAGSFNVSGGLLRNTSTGLPHPTLTRLIAGDKYRFTIDSLYVTEPTETAIVSTHAFSIRNIGGTVYAKTLHSALTATSIDPSQPMVIDMLETSVSFTGTGGSVTLSTGADPVIVAYINVGAFLPDAANNVRIGAVKVESYGVPASIAETSDPVSLDPADAWLIHPGTVGLSVPLAETDTATAGIVDIAPVENPSNATVHKILGSATPIPTTTGPRTDDRTTMTVATVTSAESVSLRALLAPDVPLLVQIPPSWDLDFNSGFYQVGDTSVERTGEVRSPRRIVTMPMQKVQSPVVDIENTGWSYASVAAEFATYTDLTTSFATYADLASNTRI